MRLSELVWYVIGGLQVLVMWGTQVSPDQVMSHAAKWAATFGIKEPPRWLTAKETDKVVRHVAALLLLVWGVVTLHQYFDFSIMSLSAKIFFSTGVACLATTLAINFFEPGWLEKLAQPFWLLVVGVTLAIAGLVWQTRLTPAIQVDVAGVIAPLEEKIASLTTQLGERTQERDAVSDRLKLASDELAIRTQERDAARQQPPPGGAVATPPTVPTSRPYYSGAEIDDLLKKLREMDDFFQNFEPNPTIMTLIRRAGGMRPGFAQS